jgi:hypothetical protein
MSHQPDNTKLDSWHRYFAIEANNRAWDLASKASRTDDELHEMLNLAHASAMHWSAVGTDQNVARAKYLVAEVHALAGNGEYSRALTEEVMQFFDIASLKDWEAAYIYTIRAHALSLEGTDDEKVSSYQQAEASVSAISDAEERKIVEQTFNQVPAP